MTDTPTNLSDEELAVEIRNCVRKLNEACAAAERQNIRVTLVENNLRVTTMDARPVYNTQYAAHISKVL